MARDDVCPRCGRPLERFNGRVGYCATHKWVSPKSCGFDEEADALNREIEAEKKRATLKREEERADEIRSQKQKARMLIYAIAAVFCLVIIAVIFFVIRPSVIYGQAGELFGSCEYAAALEKYQSLGTYRDSGDRAVLSQAMMNLQNGNPQEAASQLDTLLSSGNGELSNSLAKALRELMANWNSNGLSPQVLLQLLNQADKIDPSGEMDMDTLWQEAHAGLLNGAQIDACFLELPGETDRALVELRQDYSVYAYRMMPEGNAAIVLNDAASALCEMEFARKHAGMEGDIALNCFAQACKLAPGNGSYRLEYASELAVQKDLRCADVFREAAELGADITDAVQEAASGFGPGLNLARLRLMELQVLGQSPQLLETTAQEICTAVSDWKALGLNPAEIPALIRLADEEGIDLSGVDREAAYDEAALAAAGDAAHTRFTDWDGDGYRELLTLDAAGMLCFYGLDDIWDVRSTLDTGIPGAELALVCQQAPILLVLSRDGTELLAATASGSLLGPLFREKGIQQFQADGTLVTFSRRLEGSIERRAEYQYIADAEQNRPVLLEINWQKNRYPMPEDALSVLTRYFEARAYGIEEEAGLLVAQTSATGFDIGMLEALEAPDVPGTVQASPYYTGEGCVFFEVSYSAQGQDVHTWVAAANQDGWHMAGASDSFGDARMDYSVAPLNLNASTSNLLDRSGLATYRVLIPMAGKLNLLWQFGDKASSSDSHTVAMYRDGTTGVNVFEFSLQPSPAKQQSRDLYISPGVYYLTVQAGPGGAGTYSLSLLYSPEANVELESNNTPERATVIAENVSYSGALSNAKDVDYYSFVLTERSEVNAVLSTSGEGKSNSTYTYSLWDGTGNQLSVVSVPGNRVSSETGPLFLAPGAYLVRVEKGNVHSAQPYGLTVNTSPCEFTEAESNNTYETANEIPVNQEIRASFAQEGDVDCFRFTLETDGLVQPRFSFNPTDSTAKTYVLSILDAQRQVLRQEKIGGKESAKQLIPLALPAGTYTVRVENPRFVQQEYVLEISASAVAAAELEPNDAAGQATLLNPGVPCTGILHSDNDQDYYRISFSEETTVTLEFRFPQAAAKDTAFQLSIEQNGKRLWGAKASGDSGQILQQLQFPAGDYYLRVQPSSYLSAVYTIQIKN